METEKLAPEEQIPEEEYRKPNPQDNPRNIALAEVAKARAATATAEAAETVPSIDDAGNITPPPEAAAEALPSSEAAAAAPAPSPEVPVVLAPAAPDAVDPEKDYPVVVDGQKMTVKGKAIIDAGYRTFQKETAADFRLKMASELLKEAEARAKGPTPPDVPLAPRPAEKSDADLANELQFGTPEQAATAIAELRTRGAVTPEQVQAFASQQARVAAKDELQFQDALKHVQTEYADLLGNAYLKDLFFLKENQLRAAGDRRAYRDLYTYIGDDLRKAFNLPKRAADLPAQPTPPGTVAARQARKQELPPVPRTAATRLAESAATTKAPSPSEIIASMAAKRGNTHLTSLRKGT